jgi:thiamine monophosphate kinase
LGRQGVTRETLKPGDDVVVVGNPGRNPADHRLRMVNITRPADGWKWGGTFE